ncbi:hypothetical protein AAG906_036097 [Vitis piasezkii]
MPIQGNYCQNGTTVPNPNFAIWTRQDKLLLHAIFASLLEGVVPLIAAATSSRDAWVKLHKLYANKSRSRVMNLKEKLTNITCNTHSLQSIFKPSKELLMSYGFKDISTAIRARDTLFHLKNFMTKHQFPPPQILRLQILTKLSPLGLRVLQLLLLSNLLFVVPTPSKSFPHQRPSSTTTRPNQELLSSRSPASSSPPTTTSSSLSVYPNWCAAMDDELDALARNRFHQCPGVDYHDTFSPVVKSTTIRVVLSIALSNGWPISQLDVNNDFFHGNLTEDVYMAQPPGYVDQDNPTHVCRLQKAFYGLKQTSRAWYTELKTFLLNFGFVNSKSNTSLFIYQCWSVTIYFLVYVDDLLVTGNCSQSIRKFVDALAHHFSLKDLGPLSYFLGVEAISTSDGMFLSQHKYVRDLLAKFHLEGIKDSSTPMSSTGHLTLNDGSPLANATQFRSLVGGLQYLQFTRPDIAFAVNKLAQFMHAPTQTHWTTAKRLLRYLKHTIHLGLTFRRKQHLHLQAYSDVTPPLDLRAYSDADWAGNQDSYKSTTVFVLFLGGNPISWCSKKQKTVARSSIKAEYRAVALTAAKVTWVSHLRSELGITLQQFPTIYCDNLIATYLCHIALDYHFVREKVVDGSLKVAHINTHSQLADVLTKPFSKGRFLFFAPRLAFQMELPSCGGVFKPNHRSYSLAVSFLL